MQTHTQSEPAQAAAATSSVLAGIDALSASLAKAREEITGGGLSLETFDQLQAGSCGMLRGAGRLAALLAPDEAYRAEIRALADRYEQYQNSELFKAVVASWLTGRCPDGVPLGAINYFSEERHKFTSTFSRLLSFENGDGLLTHTSTDRGWDTLDRFTPTAKGLHLYEELARRDEARIERARQNWLRR